MTVTRRSGHTTTQEYTQCPSTGPTTTSDLMGWKGRDDKAPLDRIKRKLRNHDIRVRKHDKG